MKRLSSLYTSIPPGTRGFSNFGPRYENLQISVQNSGPIRPFLYVRYIMLWRYIPFEGRDHGNSSNRGPGLGNTRKGPDH